MRRAALLAAALAAAVIPARAAESLRRGLPLEVPAPGWARVAVFSSPDELGGARWRLLGPSGRELPAHVLPPPGGDVPLRAADVHESAAGWQITLDAGPVPLVHDGIALDLARPVIAADIRIEASEDRRTWAALATGDVFRLGTAALSRTLLTYPPARQRWVRVHWPRAAGRPEFEGATIRTVPWTPERAVAGQRRRVTVAQSDGVPVADFGAAGLPIVRFAPASACPLAALDGRWRGVAVRDDAAGGDRFTPVGARAFRCRPGTGSVEAWLEPRWLLFQAPAAGRYTLTATHESSSLVTDQPPTPGDTDIREVEPGAVTALDPPALGDAALGLLQSEMPRGASTWPVLADGAAAGDVVRVKLAPEILAQARPGSLRPVSGGKVIPFVRVTDEMPRASAPVSPPRQTGQAGSRTTLEIDLPEHAGLLTQLELRAVRPPAQARITLAFRAAVRPGVPARVDPAGSFAWTCEAGNDDCPLLAALSIPEGTELLEVTIQGADGQPVEVAAARFLRSVTALVFAWPEGGGVRLVSGFDEHSNDPSGEASLREQLLTRVARSARVDLASVAEEAAASARYVRIALLAALVAAGAVLLIVLARALKK